MRISNIKFPSRSGKTWVKLGKTINFVHPEIDTSLADGRHGIFSRLGQPEMTNFLREGK
ncbi:hypothetical protein LguiB_013009 [Lonicera macranthoides]